MIESQNRFLKDCGGLCTDVLRCLFIFKEYALADSGEVAKIIALSIKYNNPLPKREVYYSERQPMPLRSFILGS